jgi:class 3 adenylate cyclase/lipopolysaccharide biosynthesis regulator YciM
MLKYITILVLLVANLQANAQLQGQARLDSLEAELSNAKGDTNHVRLLNMISFEYYRINPNKGSIYAEKGLTVAKEIDWERGKAISYTALAINNDVRGETSKALKYFHKALKIREELGNKYGIASNLGNIGNLYGRTSNFKKAIEYYQKALKIREELDDKIGISNILGNMGSIYSKQSDYPKALASNFKALKINEEIDNKNGIASNLYRVGIIYEHQKDDAKAIEFYQKAFKISMEIGDQVGMSYSLIGIGNIYSNQSDYARALEYYQRALKIVENSGFKSLLATTSGNIGNIYFNQSDYARALEYYQKALKIFENIGAKDYKAEIFGNIGQTYLALSQDSVNINPNELNEYVSLNKDINQNLSIEYLTESIKIFEEIGELDIRSQSLRRLTEAYEQKGEYKKAFESYKEYKELQDSVFNMEKGKEIASLSATREKEVAEKELKIQKLENVRRRNESYALYGGLGFLALVVIVIFRQRRQSERLLLNILPAKIAKRLKRRKGDIADDIENASTVFIDLVGFTAYSKDKKASDVLKMLNQVFSRMDKLVLKHGLEKIKTIGDGYMAAAGVPEYQEDHAKRAAAFAIDVHRELEKFNSENSTDIKARIGIESGPLVAGVIGDMKFIYDLWGDSVNTASRMESTGTPNKVHITENFKLELEKHKNGFTFSEPVELEIKGKGIMKTFYLKTEKIEN